MIPVEIQESSPRFHNFVIEESNEERKVNLNLLDEVREQTRINSEALKRRVELKQKSKLKPRLFRVTTRALREHVGEECSYDRRAFAKRHDDDIAVLSCTLGESVCGDERSNNGVPFFYFYQVVFKRVGVRLPFSRFERESC